MDATHDRKNEVGVENTGARTNQTRGVANRRCQGGLV